MIYPNKTVFKLIPQIILKSHHGATVAQVIKAPVMSASHMSTGLSPDCSLLMCQGKQC